MKRFVHKSFEKWHDEFRPEIICLYEKIFTKPSTATRHWSGPRFLPVTADWYWPHSLMDFLNDSDIPRMFKSLKYLNIIAGGVSGRIIYYRMMMQWTLGQVSPNLSEVLETWAASKDYNYYFNPLSKIRHNSVKYYRFPIPKKRRNSI